MNMEIKTQEIHTWMYACLLLVLRAKLLLLVGSTVFFSSLRRCSCCWTKEEAADRENSTRFFFLFSHYSIQPEWAFCNSKAYIDMSTKAFELGKTLRSIEFKALKVWKKFGQRGTWFSWSFTFHQPFLFHLLPRKSISFSPLYLSNFAEYNHLSCCGGQSTRHACILFLPMFF